MPDGTRVQCCLLFFFLISDFVSRCMDDRLTPFYSKALEFNAHIQHVGDTADLTNIGLTNHQNIPYVGNGYFGIEIGQNAEFYVKYGRHLSQSIPYQPIVNFKYLNENGEDKDENEPYGKLAIVTDYINGVVQKFQCFGNDFFISNDFYGNFKSLTRILRYFY